MEREEGGGGGKGWGENEWKWESKRERQAGRRKLKRSQTQTSNFNYLIFFERWKADGRVTVLSKEKLQTKCLQRSVSKTKEIILLKNSVLGGNKLPKNTRQGADLKNRRTASKICVWNNFHHHHPQHTKTHRHINHLSQCGELGDHSLLALPHTKAHTHTHTSPLC